ncbi:MAG: nitroreductase family protein [Alkalispirochaeta sp.]
MSADMLLQLLERHASCRSYHHDPVPRADIERIVSAAQRAATSSNLQMWSAVVVESDATRQRLAELCGDQQHIREAPVFIAWCADRHRLDIAAELQGYRQDTEFLESFMVAVVDAAIAMQNATIAAEAMGYGTCYIGGLRNHTAEVVELLQLPATVFPVAGMTMGVPAKVGKPRPRLDRAAVLHWERYQPVSTSVLRAYDRVMQASGVYRGRQVAGTTAAGHPAAELPAAEYGWMEHSARRVSRPSRKDLSATARRQGYGLR